MAKYTMIAKMAAIKQAALMRMTTAIVELSPAMILIARDHMAQKTSKAKQKKSMPIFSKTTYVKYCFCTSPAEMAAPKKAIRNVAANKISSTTNKKRNLP